MGGSASGTLMRSSIALPSPPDDCAAINVTDLLYFGEHAIELLASTRPIRSTRANATDPQHSRECDRSAALARVRPIRSIARPFAAMRDRCPAASAIIARPGLWRRDIVDEEGPATGSPCTPVVFRVFCLLRLIDCTLWRAIVAAASPCSRTGPLLNRAPAG